MKTQQGTGGASDANDINDPIVQDVLNEFQEELMLSKQPRTPQAQQPPYIPLSPHPHTSQHPQQQSQSQHPHASHASQHPQASQASQHPPMSPHYPSYSSSPYGYSKYDNISSYLDTEVAKKSLILVILAVIIYHSGIINTVYEKMPDYLQDNLTNFDIYIKSASLFSIIYVLSFFEYI
jgi:hypothetical protein